MIIHINGWPGVGKLTVARLVARRLGARLVDNHVILNPALAVTDHGSDAFTAITGEVRSLVLAHMAEAPPGEIFVLTDAFEARNPIAIETFAGIAAVAGRRGAPLLSVCLDCDPDENARRLAARTRVDQRKLTDVEVLMGYRRTLDLLRPDVPHRVDLDTTRLGPEEVAERIVAAARPLLEDS